MEMTCEECNVCKQISAETNSTERVTTELAQSTTNNDPAKIELLIVGESPYPTSPVPEFAFCKPTWIEQVEYNCCGRLVLCSLGIKLEKVSNKYPFPKNMFEDLTNKGIIFQNLYLELNKDKSPSRKHKNPKIDNLTSKASKVVLCGRETHIIAQEKSDFICAIHPAARCRDYCQEWKKFWGGKGNLLNLLEPSGSGPIHTIINNINSL